MRHDTRQRAESVIGRVLTYARPSAVFCEEAEAEYESRLVEIAEARSRQLDAETDAYARSFYGAGYTECLLAIEG